jgi:hypothetical protein
VSKPAAGGWPRPIPAHTVRIAAPFGQAKREVWPGPMLASSSTVLPAVGCDVGASLPEPVQCFAVSERKGRFQAAARGSGSVRLVQVEAADAVRERER